VGGIDNYRHAPFKIVAQGPHLVVGEELGQRVKSTMGGVTTVHISNYFEWSGSANNKKQYYYAGSARIAERSGSSTLYWLVGDHLGSTTVVADSAGNQAAVQLYMPWGQQRYSSGSLPTSFGFTGQRQEPDLGLYFYAARWYDPCIMQFNQPDTVIPDTYNALDWNRYSYGRYNPLKYNDPSGHWPEWNSVGEFFMGLSMEFTRTNNWVGAIASPSVAESLASSPGESDAMMIGRAVGDVLTIAVGVAEVSGGIGLAGGGAVVGCGATLCLASAPALAAGVAVAGYGVGTSVSGAAALGENLGRLYSRSKNDLKPDPNATGPHSTFKRDPVTGKVTNYETYQPQSNPQNPNPWEKILRYDGVGKAHPDTINKQSILPHVHDFMNNEVRGPYRYEIPK
jgi:RHS repeat-associated protein